MPATDNEADLESLWRFVAIPLFFYCGAMWLRTQTDSFELIKFIAKDVGTARIAGLFAIPVAAIALFICIRYARLVRDANASSRIDRVPRLLEKGLDGRTGRLFRVALFSGFWLVVLGSQVHALHALFDQGVVDTASCMKVSGKEMLFATSSSSESKVSPCTPEAKPPRWDNRYRFAGPNGVTYFPIIETWLFLIALAALLIYFAGYVFRLLLRSSVANLNASEA